MKKVVFTFTPKRYTLPYTSNVHEQIIEFLPASLRQQWLQDLTYTIEQGWLLTSDLSSESPVTDANGKGIWVDLDTNTYTRIFECTDVEAFMNFFQQQPYYSLFVDHYDANTDEATYKIEIVD